MKSITGFALGLAAVLTVPAVFAGEHKTKTHSTTTSTTSDSSMTGSTGSTSGSDTSGMGGSVNTGSTGVGVSGTAGTSEGLTTDPYDANIPSTPSDTTGTGTMGTTGAYGGGPTVGYTAPATSTTTTTMSTTSAAPANDYYVHEGKREDDRRRVRSGVGLNVFGAAGARDEARLGVGGRIEFVMPFGLTLGGSYTQHFTSDADRTAVRPLLGEVGWAIPVVKHVEVRPMVGLGYAFAAANTGGDVNRPSNSQTTNASVSGVTSGMDVAPGAKVSWVGRGFEVFTLPKYHFISGNNFLGVEVGAGARF